MGIDTQQGTCTHSHHSQYNIVQGILSPGHVHPLFIQNCTGNAIPRTCASTLYPKLYREYYPQDMCIHSLSKIVQGIPTQKHVHPLFIQNCTGNINPRACAFTRSTHYLNCTRNIKPKGMCIHSFNSLSKLYRE